MVGDKRARLSRATLLVGVATGGLAGLGGGVLGLLVFQGGLGLRANLHPQLMVYGFLAPFILGVAQALLPRLNRTSHPEAGWLAVWLLPPAVVCWLVPHAKLLGDLLLEASATLFSVFVFSNIRRPRNSLGYGNLYFAAGSLALLTAATLNMKWGLSGADGWGDPSYAELALLGFPLSIVLGVWQHTAHFRAANPSRPLSLAAASLWSATLVALALNATFAAHQNLPAVVLEGSSLALFLLNVSALRPTRIPQIWAFDPNRSRYKWFDRTVRIASLWLVVSVFLQAAYELGYGGAPLLDAWTHTLAVGFYVTMISGYAPILLPILLSGRTGGGSPTLAPQALTSLGVAMRVVGDALAHWLSGPSYTLRTISPIPVFVGVALFLIFVHSSVSKRRVAGPVQTERWVESNLDGKPSHQSASRIRERFPGPACGPRRPHTPFRR